MPNNITITDRVIGATFSVTDDGVTLSGNYRKGTDDNKIREFSFSGSIPDADGFSGHIDPEGRFSLYNVPLDKAATVVSLVNAVHAEAISDSEASAQ